MFNFLNTFGIFLKCIYCFKKVLNLLRLIINNMKQTCKFCEGADIVEVVPSLGVNVANAIATGIIQDTSATVFHNMMQDLGEVGMVARDPFDIIEYEHSYAKFRKYVKDKESSKDKDKNK